MKKILVINGPNLNMLGKRKENHYGNLTLDAVETLMVNHSKAFEFDLSFYQSNSEGQIIDCIHSYSEYDGIIINAGAYTHYSHAIGDALEIVDIPVIEVHLSNIHSREGFRKTSVIARACEGQISGFKEYSYVLALHALKDILE